MTDDIAPQHRLQAHPTARRTPPSPAFAQSRQASSPLDATSPCTSLRPHAAHLTDLTPLAAGDQALKTLSQAILQRVRSTDVVARLGGDEFAIVLSEVDEPHALIVAEDIRTAVAARELDPEIHITCGLVPFDEHRNLLPDDALIAADTALYQAKNNGKNQVQIYHGASRARVNA
jgi:predicted signal transduction protein with EAL and GGDEF domain